MWPQPFSAMAEQSSFDPLKCCDVVKRATTVLPRRITLDLTKGNSSVFVTSPREQHRKRQAMRIEKAWTDGQLFNEHNFRSNTLPEPASEKMKHLVDGLNRGTSHATQGNNPQSSSPEFDKASKKTLRRRDTISEIRTNEEVVEDLLGPAKMHPVSGSCALPFSPAISNFGARPSNPDFSGSGTASDASGEKAEVNMAPGGSGDDQPNNPEECRHAGVQRRASEQTMVLGLKSLASRQRWRYMEPVKDSCQRVMLRKKVNGEARRFTEIYARTVNILDKHMTLDPPVEKRHSVDPAELKDYSSSYDEAMSPPSSFSVTSMRSIVSSKQSLPRGRIPEESDAYGINAEQVREQAQALEVVKNMVLIQQRMRIKHEQGGPIEANVFVTHRASRIASTQTSLGEIVRKVKQISMSLSTASATGRFARTVPGTCMIGEATLMEEELLAG
mmetsp:Transcript_72194/g.143188  ORF Transcript_72194/g.143188 Transcript_72194/m.143188 type:complete len:445 (+) Transcript_72194:28-1362(+)